MLPGVELGYDVRDTCNSPVVGLQEAIDLILSSKTDSKDSGSCGCKDMSESMYVAASTPGIVGPAISSASLQVALLGHLLHMPQISHSSTSPLLSNRHHYKYFRRTISPEILQIHAIIDVLVHFEWKHVSIISTNDTYGVSSMEEFTHLLVETGICIDMKLMVSLEARGIDENVLDELGSSRARVVVLLARGKSVVDLLTLVNHNLTLKRRFTWIVSDCQACSASLFHHINETAAGLFGIAPVSKYLREFEEYFSQLTINSNTRNDWFPEVFAARANCILLGKTAVMIPQLSP